MPLVSIAVSDPRFQNKEHNTWSGQVQGLTVQRSVRALEDYGHVAELTLVGRALTAAAVASAELKPRFHGTSIR